MKIINNHTIRLTGPQHNNFFLLSIFFDSLIKICRSWWYQHATASEYLIYLSGKINISRKKFQFNTFFPLSTRNNPRIQLLVFVFKASCVSTLMILLFQIIMDEDRVRYVPGGRSKTKNSSIC